MCLANVGVCLVEMGVYLDVTLKDRFFFVHGFKGFFLEMGKKFGKLHCYVRGF